MTNERYCDGLTAIKATLAEYYGKTAPDQYKIHAECLDYGIKAIKALDTYKDAYHKGYEDCAEAMAYLNELEQEEAEKEEKCSNCKYYHMLKHNRVIGKRHEISHCCDVLLHIEKEDAHTFILEVSPDDVCEMYKERTDAEQSADDSGNYFICAMECSNYIRHS